MHTKGKFLGTRLLFDAHYTVYNDTIFNFNSNSQIVIFNRGTSMFFLLYKLISERFVKWYFPFTYYRIQLKKYVHHSFLLFTCTVDRVCFFYVCLLWFVCHGIFVFVFCFSCGRYTGICLFIFLFFSLKILFAVEEEKFLVTRI